MYVENYCHLKLNASVECVVSFEMQWHVMCSMWLVAHSS